MELRWRVLPRDLDAIADGAVLTGIAANVDRLGIAYQRERDGLDVYVTEDAVKQLGERFRPEQRSTQPNLVLRIPQGSSWILDRETASVPVVAVDLLNHSDTRVRRAARSLLERLADDYRRP